MCQDITTKAHAITAPTTREGAPRENTFQLHGQQTERFHQNESSSLLCVQKQLGFQTFVDEVYKILYAMGFNEEEKAELAAYQLNDVSQVR